MVLQNIRVLASTTTGVCQLCRKGLKTSASYLNCNRSRAGSRMDFCNKVYTQRYPALLVKTDGSTVRIKYHEPRRIIQLPIDINELSESEKQARLEERKPKKKLAVVEEVEDNFDANRYSHLWKK